MPTIKRPLIAAALSLLVGAAAYAQSFDFTFRTDVTGGTGDPAYLMTLVSGSGLGMELNAGNAVPGTPIGGDTRVLTYRNEVSRDLTVSVSVSPNEDNFVIIADGCSGTVLVGAQCSVTVQFQAAEDGTYSGTLNVDAS